MAAHGHIEKYKQRYNFDDRYWKDCGDYFLNLSVQGSEDWHSNRKFRLTASNFGAAVGLSNFSSPMDVALDITNIKNKVFDKTSMNNMQHGVVHEPIAREWYCNNRNVKVNEVGLAVPKWQVRIGASLDGDVLDDNGNSGPGMIEIKCPKTMYNPLINHVKKINQGWQVPINYHDHIWETHYAQMQGCMAVTKKQWCDYIVYATDSKKTYTERINFNPDYWNNFLYPQILNFLDNTMEPLIEKGYNSDLFL